MKQNGYGQIKYACYTVNLSMSVVGTLSPLLFLTFRTLYGLSFSMLGALVLVNFCTQLAVDLLFSFYSHKINIARAVKLTPALTALGMLVYAVFPLLVPQAVYAGLVIGTVIFAASGGLVEVLISPVIAALPAENPEREMSKLHSVYAWGVVAVVIVNTLLLSLLGKEQWPWIALGWAAIPCLSFVLFLRSEVPPLETPGKSSNTLSLLRQKEFLVCFFCIFLGGASECTMSQWSSGYLEQAFAIPKVWGDVGGVAMFAAMLGLGRTLYSRYGRQIEKILLLGAASAAVCYLTAVLSPVPLVGLVACALTGFCTSMLWPGSLIVVSERFPAAGVAVFALMAAGGDLGGAIGPQLVGSVVDLAMASESVQGLAAALSLTAEQLSMKIGLACAVVFPVLAAVLYARVYRDKARRS